MAVNSENSLLFNNTVIMQNNPAVEANSRSVQITHQLQIDFRNHPHPELSGDLDLRLQLLSRLDLLLAVNL